MVREERPINTILRPMKNKRLPKPQRARQLPLHWSWIDHRLVSEHHLRRCSAQAWTLYLFLLSVGNAQGLSYYATASIASRLGWSASLVVSARGELLRADLIAFEKPFYQVLELPSPHDRARPAPQGRTLDLGTALRKALEQINTDKP